MDLAWEAAANGEKWMAEVARQSARLLDVGAPVIHRRFGAAMNKIYGALQRSVGGVASVLELSDAPEVREQVSALNTQLAAFRDVQAEKLAAQYRRRCAELGIRPETPSENEDVARYDRMVPRKLHRFYTEEYQAATARFRQFFPAGLSLPRLASSEIAWFVDGRRSISEIWRLVRAEYGNVTTGNDEWKFAYVVTPETQDIDLGTVVAYVEAMEQAGMVEILRR
jgi:hypothetical protein